MGYYSSVAEYMLLTYISWDAVQVYRMCMSLGAGGQAFLCPEGTKFNQRTLVCDHARRVKCSEASSFFHRNLIIHEASMKVDRLNSSKKKTANKEQQGNFFST